jgi:hypothetical protein
MIRIQLAVRCSTFWEQCSPRRIYRRAPPEQNHRLLTSSGIFEIGSFVGQNDGVRRNDAPPVSSLIPPTGHCRAAWSPVMAILLHTGRGRSGPAPWPSSRPCGTSRPAPAVHAGECRSSQIIRDVQRFGLERTCEGRPRFSCMTSPSCRYSNDFRGHLGFDKQHIPPKPSPTGRSPRWSIRAPLICS